MTSYPCNKYEQITPSYLLSVKYIIIATSAKLKALDCSSIIKLNDKPIARTVGTPSLGVIIDEALAWEPYVQLLSFKIAS